MGEFGELMSYYKFDKFPRYVGNPYQQFVHTYNEFYTFVYLNNGRDSVYTSVNSYKDEKMLYEQMFFDFDTKEYGFETAKEELKNIYNEFKEYNKIMSFSGSGFHFYLRCKPILEKPENINVKEYQMKFGYETLDLMSAEAKHITRIPASRYVKKGVDYKRYCIPINEEVLNWNKEKIYKLSEMRNINYRENNKDKELYDFTDIVHENKSVYVIPENNLITSDELEGEKFDILMYEVLDGLYDKLKEPNPSHETMFISALKLKSFGLNIDECIKVFDKLSFNWKGYNNKKERIYQIETIYRRDYYYKI